jgi:hypothetical protein
MSTGGNQYGKNKQQGGITTNSFTTPTICVNTNTNDHLQNSKLFFITNLYQYGVRVGEGQSYEMPQR